MTLKTSQMNVPSVAMSSYNALSTLKYEKNMLASQLATFAWPPTKQYVDQKKFQILKSRMAEVDRKISLLEWLDSNMSAYHNVLVLLSYLKKYKTSFVPLTQTMSLGGGWDAVCRRFYSLAYPKLPQLKTVKDKYGILGFVRDNFSKDMGNLNTLSLKIQSLQKIAPRSTSSNQAFAKAMQFVMPTEGAYTYDTGGHTMRGITLDSWNMYETPKIPESQAATLMPKIITHDRAVAFYKKNYWVANKLDLVAVHYPLTAIALLDIAINGGPGKASEIFQRSVQTMSSKKPLEPSDDLRLALLVNDNMRAFREQLSKHPKYAPNKNGWTNRANNLDQFLKTVG